MLVHPIPDADEYRLRCLFATAICAFALRTRLTLKNKKNRERLAAMSQGEKNGLSDDAEIWDNDPRYVFMV